MAADKPGQTRESIAVNLRDLRAHHHLSQEELAEKVGVTRQAVAKWENGETLPDILNCEALAEVFGVSLNDLVRYDAAQEGIPIPPRDKHLFGTVTLNDKGQIVLPKKARDIFGFKPGDVLVVLGDTTPGNAGIALVDGKSFIMFGKTAAELPHNKPE